MRNEPVIIGGKYHESFTYGMFQKEMDMFNKAFAEVMIEGDGIGQPFSFPIPTYNVMPNWDWDGEIIDKIMQLAAKYGSPYFQNFLNSDLDPKDIRSMCCRLQMDLREITKRTGGLFGAGDLTGSVGVVTLNLPRMAYLSDNEEQFFENIKKYCDIAYRQLELKRMFLNTKLEQGFYPSSKIYLKNGFRGFFSTLGINGGHEACLNLLGKGIETEEGKDLMLRVEDFIRDLIKDYQEESGNIYNLEATPAEGACYRFAKRDRMDFGDKIIQAGTPESPYYTNSTMLPVGFTDDPIVALMHQNELQRKYSGGTVFHSFFGERITDIQALKEYLKMACTKTKIPYISITPTFSTCPSHGYTSGEQPTCPTCGEEALVYSRVVGYYRPVSRWNIGKKQEFIERLEYTSPEGPSS